jgi:DNA (cytosine-5)-methyltransferase 1
MTRPVYYNEIDGYCAAWLRNLIVAGHLPAGDVDERDIRDVRAADLAGYGACHFFAGIGGFALGLRIAGLPDDFPIWTGGWPCQPFSVAGKRQGRADDGHLWPELHRLLVEARPAWLLGENVAGFVEMELDGVLADLEGSGYATRAVVVPACAVDAPHRRDRLWIVARDVGLSIRDGRQPRLPAAAAVGHGRSSVAAGGALPDAIGDELRHEPGRRDGARRQGSAEPRDNGSTGALADTGGERLEEPQRVAGDAGAEQPAAARGGLGGASADVADAARSGQRRGTVGAEARARAELGERCRWLPEPGIRRVAHGVPARVAKLRALGNAVVPQVVAEIARAILVEHGRAAA